MSRTILTLAACLSLSFGCAGTSNADGPLVAKTEKSGTFEVRHAFTIAVPEKAGRLDAWLPLPSATDPAQKVSDLTIAIEPPTEHRVTTDTQGNEFLHVWAENPAPGTIEIVTRFKVQRWELKAVLDAAKTRPHTDEERVTFGAYLLAGTHDAATPEIPAVRR